MSPIPTLVVAGLCGVIFLVVFVKGLCEAAKEPDERNRLVQWHGECWLEPEGRKTMWRRN